MAERSMPVSKIKVLYVEDHAMVREALTLLINGEPDMTVVAGAATGTEAIQLFGRHLPDVTLMDLQLPGISGVEAVNPVCAAGDSGTVLSRGASRAAVGCDAAENQLLIEVASVNMIEDPYSRLNR